MNVNVFLKRSIVAASLMMAAQVSADVARAAAAQNNCCGFGKAACNQPVCKADQTACCGCGGTSSACTCCDDDTETCVVKGGLFKGTATCKKKAS